LSLEQLLIILSIAIFITIVPIIFFLYGVQRVGASKGALIGSVEPALTILIAYPALGEVMSAMQIIGSALVLISIFLALYPQRKEA
jgi:drug/metabolite transporter (DMT)-like permease